MRTPACLATLLLLASSCSSRPPYEIAITGPTGPFKGAAEITVTPQPEDGVIEVRFSVDGVERAVDTEAPFAAELDFSKEWGGAHHVTAVAERDDGVTAEASIDVTFDPLGPFVTVLKPTGTRVPPEGGTIDVAFLAEDPSGIAAGAVQLDDGDPIAIPIPGLALTVAVPEAIDPPGAPKLSWWFEDTVGNRTEGVVDLLQTHELFAAPIQNQGSVVALPGGRVVVVNGTGVQAFEADGTGAWSVGAGGRAFVGAVAAAGGDLIISANQPAIVMGPFAALRIHADGSKAWEWAIDESSSFLAMAYIAESDSVITARLRPAMNDTQLVWIDTTGHEKPLTSLPPATEAQILVTPEGASPAGFAVATPVADVIHFDVFDAGGAAAWSGDLGKNLGATALLTRDALFGPSSSMAGAPFVIRGPGGDVATPGGVEVFTVARNGDVVFSAPSAADTATRMRPDGSVAWQTHMGAKISKLAATGQHVAVTAGAALRIVDGAGGTVDWIPDADSLVPGEPTAVVSPSGAFWVVGNLESFRERVYRAAADGTTLWHETVSESGTIAPGFLDPSDEHLVALVRGTTTSSRVHVFGP